MTVVRGDETNNFEPAEYIFGSSSFSFYGYEGNDTMDGGFGRDTFYGDIGDDRGLGRYGDDVLYLGPGNDVGLGGSGRDFIDGGADDDVIRGGADNDRLRGNTGADSVYGGPGDDHIWGFGRDVDENDQAVVGSADFLVGGTGNDTIEYEGALGFFDFGHFDRIRGGSGDDVILANDVTQLGTNALIKGNNGNDQIRSGWGNDKVWGGNGDDTIVLQGGADTVTGGNGADTFVWADGPGRAVVRDFDAEEGDAVRLYRSLWGEEMKTAQEVWDSYGQLDAKKMVLDFGDAGQIIFRGTTDVDGLIAALTIVDF